MSIFCNCKEQQREKQIPKWGHLNERTCGIGAENDAIGPNAPLLSKFGCTEGNVNPGECSTPIVDNGAWLRRIEDQE